MLLSTTVAVDAVAGDTVTVVGVVTVVDETALAIPAEPTSAPKAIPAAARRLRVGVRFMISLLSGRAEQVVRTTP